MGDKIEIPLSKIKIALLLIGAVIFVVLGVFFILRPEQFASVRFRNAELIRWAGVAATAFFGFCSVFIARKLFDTKAGLIIDWQGITDNSNGTSVGLIEWDDITGIETFQVVSTRILFLHTDKPDKYIGRVKNRILKHTMKANHKKYGSPLSIISGSLNMNFDELEKLIVSEFERRGRNA